MTPMRDRLAKCFLSVVPNLTQEEICEVNVVALVDIDSWAVATLSAVVDEEFGVEMSPDQFLELGTFQAIEEYLAKHGGARAELEKHDS